MNKNDPRDAYLEHILEEELEGRQAPDLTDRIVRSMDRKAEPPHTRWRPTLAQIAASVLFFIAIFSIILISQKEESRTVSHRTRINDAIDRMAKALNEEQNAAAEQALVDIGEPAIRFINEARERLNGRADRIIRRIQWKKEILNRDEIRGRLVKLGTGLDAMPKDYSSPVPIVDLLQERTNVPILFGSEYRVKDTPVALKLDSYSNGYTVLEEVLREFNLTPILFDGGIYVTSTPPPSERMIVGRLLETLERRDRRRSNVTAAKILVSLAGKDFGYNPYGSRERRLKASRALIEWYRSLPGP